MRIVALLVGVVLVAGCSAPESVGLVFEGPIMGTRYRVRVDDELAPGRGEALGERIRETLDRVNGRMSTWLPDSEVSRFNSSRSTEPFELSQETFAVLAAAQDLSADSGGAFDVTVGALVDAWGFGPVGSPDAAPAPDVIAGLLEHTGHDNLRLDPERRTLQKLDPQVQVDLSAIAKGYAVDAVAEALEREGLGSFMVEVGGEVRTRGLTRHREPWRIGIERPVPETRGEVERLVALVDLAMASSGNYRNFYEIDGQVVAHTIDPRTGQPARHPAVSASVVTDSCMRADGLATALLVMGPEEGLAWAEARDLAVMFVVREADAFIEHRTAAFDRLIAAGVQ